ncbi:MAG TPA: hypothetical protein VHB79_25690 [Polyangiaceae bacterium]|nr:hypothetical protein [Polyangiaceae bacterium]
MIKVCAGIVSVGFVFLSGAVGCSSASTPDDGSGGTTSAAGTKTNTNTAGTTVVPSGGTGSATGGTGSTTAGTASTTAGTDSGTAGTAATTGGTSSGTGGTASTTGGTGAGGNSPACKGIKTGMACMPEGTDCPALTCGLADTGTRACKCMSTWMCGSCDFSASPFKDKPADITKCTGVEADKVTCTEKGKVCDGAAGGEVCACWTDDEGALIWDCDKPPTTWAAPAM